MDIERARAFLLSLPDALETDQFGGLVYWIGDKRIGGKMFAWLTLASDRGRVCAFATTPEHFHELLEQDGLFPAPYLARAHWVAAETWSSLRDSEWRTELTSAADRIRAALPPKAKKHLALSRTEQKKALSAAAKKAPRTKDSKLKN